MPPRKSRQELPNQLTFGHHLEQEVAVKAAEDSSRRQFRELYGENVSWDEFKQDQSILEKGILESNEQASLLLKWLAQEKTIRDTPEEFSGKLDRVLERVEKMKGTPGLLFLRSSVPVIEGVNDGKDIWNHELVVCSLSKSMPSIMHRGNRFQLVLPIEYGAEYTSLRYETKKMNSAKVMAIGEMQELETDSIPLHLESIMHFATSDTGQSELLLLQPVPEE